jgi:hypothetical protein
VVGACFVGFGRARGIPNRLLSMEWNEVVFDGGADRSLLLKAAAGLYTRAGIPRRGTQPSPVAAAHVQYCADCHRLHGWLQWDAESLWSLSLSYLAYAKMRETLMFLAPHLRDFAAFQIV